jgi:uncharacterized membrane protein YbaN (DUF454 family)
MRSSPRLHRWMHQHPTLGPLLTNWYEHGAVTKRVKSRGVLFILLSFSLSIHRYLHKLSKKRTGQLFHPVDFLWRVSV